MEPGEKIVEARKRHGWSQAQLANRVGISQPAIKKIEAGETRQSKFMPKIAQVLGLDIADLIADLNTDLTIGQDARATGAGGPDPYIQQDRLMAIGRADFPVHASAEGGPGQIIVSSDAVDFMPRPWPLAHVPRSYGLLVTGTSMEPEYRHGDTALVNPHLPVVGGEVYIFYAEKEGQARATIKHLRRATEEKWFVTQHNPPPGTAKDFVLARHEWQWAHRVLGKYSRR